MADSAAENAVCLKAGRCHVPPSGHCYPQKLSHCSLFRLVRFCEPLFRGRCAVRQHLFRRHPESIYEYVQLEDVPPPCPGLEDIHTSEGYTLSCAGTGELPLIINAFLGTPEHRAVLACR